MPRKRDGSFSIGRKRFLTIVAGEVAQPGVRNRCAPGRGVGEADGEERALLIFRRGGAPGNYIHPEQGQGICDALLHSAPSSVRLSCPRCSRSSLSS